MQSVRVWWCDLFLNSIDQVDAETCTPAEDAAGVSEEDETADEDCCKDDSEDEDYMPS